MNKEQVVQTAKAATKGIVGLVGTIGVGTVMTKAVKAVNFVPTSRFDGIALKVGFYFISAAITQIAVSAISEEIDGVIDLVAGVKAEEQEKVIVVPVGTIFDPNAKML